MSRALGNNDHPEGCFMRYGAFYKAWSVSALGSGGAAVARRALCPRQGLDGRRQLRAPTVRLPGELLQEHTLLRAEMVSVGSGGI